MAAAGALLLLAAAAVQAASAPDLTARERARLLVQACGESAAAEPQAGRIELEGTAPRNRRAFVACAPHGVESRLLAARVTFCQADRAAWQCAPATEALEVTLPDGHLVAVARGDLPADLAVQVVVESTRLTVPPFHKPARHFLKQLCTVRQLPGSLFAGATHFVLGCPGIELSLTRHCHTATQCRWFVAEGRERPDQNFLAR